MIPLFTAKVPKGVDQALLETLHSGYITQGPKVEEFEAKFGRFVENPNVVSVNSGTSALTLALRLAGVEPGDEVITTPMTCSATNLPILALGGKPVFADVDPASGLISPADVEARVTSKTKAIMCCDWGGMPCDLDALMDIAIRHGLKLIEDAAHALGASYKGRAVGSVAHFTCFSFQAIKHMTTVDGGALTCLDPEDAKRGKRLRWFGIDRSSEGKDTRINEDIVEWGYKFHMNDVTATLGIAQLDYIAHTLEDHRETAHFYRRMLSGFYDQPEEGENQSAWWLYTLVLPSKTARDAFKSWMGAENIINPTGDIKPVQVSQVHRRNDEYSVFAAIPQRGVKGIHETPGLDSFADRMICIPVHSNLSLHDVTYIIERCNDFASGYSRASAEMGEEL